MHDFSDLRNTDDEFRILHDRCELAAKIWSRTFSGLGAVTFREKGEKGVCDLWSNLLREHQKGFYNEGLEKLGISTDEPPAIVAAKYHYFTNIIGGLEMDYMEESEKKVWIRYRAPMWTYAGITMLAMPSRLRRVIFSAWHPFNGVMMGNKRLGWVATKFVMEGDPYDEGYFIEYENDITLEETLRYETVHSTPEFELGKAPKFDTSTWPPARILKARRNWSREYVRETVQSLFNLYGEQATLYILAQVMRGVAIQYTPEIRHDLSISGCDLGACTAVLAGILEAFDQNFTVVKVDHNTARFELDSFKPFRPGEASDGIRAACFEFPTMVTRMMNGQMSLTRTPVVTYSDPGRETWILEDKERWLW